MFFYVLTSCLIRPSYFNISLRSLQFNFSPTPAAVGNLYCPSWPPPFSSPFSTGKKVGRLPPFFFWNCFLFQNFLNNKLSHFMSFCFWLSSHASVLPSRFLFLLDILLNLIFNLSSHSGHSLLFIIQSINMKIPFREEEQSESQYLTWDSAFSLFCLKFSDAKRLSIVSMSILNFSLSLLDIKILKSVKLSGY